MGIPDFQTVSIHHVLCCHEGCEAMIIMPGAVMEKFRENHEWWYCYNGHTQHFSHETKEEKLRAELDRAKRKTKEARDRADNERSRADTLKRSRNVYKGKLKATKERIKNGVCPCCNRSFANIRRHMKAKHPGYASKAGK